MLSFRQKIISVIGFTFLSLILSFLLAFEAQASCCQYGSNSLAATLNTPAEKSELISCLNGVTNTGISCKAVEPNSQTACETSGSGGLSGIYLADGVKINDLRCGCPKGKSLKVTGLSAACVNAVNTSEASTGPCAPGEICFVPQVSIPFTTIQKGVPIKYPAVDNCSGGSPIIKDNVVGTYVVEIYKFFTYIAGFLAVIMFMIGGFQYMVSRDTKSGEAKKIMTQAAIGLVFIFGSFQFLRLISSSLVRLSPLSIESVCEDKMLSENYRSCSEYEALEAAKPGSYAFAVDKTGRQLTFAEAKNTIMKCGSINDPVVFAKGSDGKFKPAGTCSPSFCSNSNLSCLFTGSGNTYSCQNPDNALIRGTITKSQNTAGPKQYVEQIHAVNIINTDNSYNLLECAKTGELQIYTAALKNCPTRITFSPNCQYLNYPEISCGEIITRLPHESTSGDNKIGNGLLEYQLTTTADPGENTKGFGILAQSDFIEYRSKGYKTNIVLIANLHTTGDSSCKAGKDGNDKDGKKDDDRWFFVGKNGVLSQSIKNLDPNFVIDSSFEIASGYNLNTIKLKPVTDRNINLANMTYKDFCAFN